MGMGSSKRCLHPLLNLALGPPRSKEIPNTLHNSSAAVIPPVDVGFPSSGMGSYQAHPGLNPSLKMWTLFATVCSTLVGYGIVALVV